MSESVAARVSDETKQWLESEAEDRDSTVSGVVASILEEQSGDVPDELPVEDRIERLEDAVGKLVPHAKKLEREQKTGLHNCRGTSTPDDGFTYPVLPGDETAKRILEQIRN